MATLTVGTMNFGTRTSAAESKRIIERALELGLTRFDTANMYGDGASETILGEVLEGRRAQVHLATKVGIFRNEGLGKARVVAALDESLKRLRTDHVDLYYLHQPDPKTPFDETLEGLAQVLKAGKAKAWGVSNFAAWQIAELDHRAPSHGLPKASTSQVIYNLLVRQLDVEYFAFARHRKLQTVIYNPLAGGLLARPPSEGPKPPKGSRLESNSRYTKRYWSGSMRGLASRVHEIAAAEGLPMVTLAYAWLFGHPDVAEVLAGPASIDHLDAAEQSVGVTLRPEVRAALDTAHREYLGTDATYAR